MSARSVIAPRKLDLGEVAQGVFEILAARPATFFGVSFLLGGLPSAVTLYRLQQHGDALAYALSPNYWIQAAIAGLLSNALLAVLLQAALAQISGRKALPAELAATGLKFFLPVLGVNTLYGLAMAIGFLLLIVPGVIVAVFWCLATPVLLAEGNFTKVFARSAALTRGNRWRILGLSIIYFVAATAIQSLLDAIGDITNITPVGIVGAAIWGSVSSAVSSVGLAVLYTHLRNLQDGGGGQSLGDVFD